MLQRAAHGAVALPGGDGGERVGARGHVRLLRALRGGAEASVEEAGDGLPDCAVQDQLPRRGGCHLLPLLRRGLLRDVELVLQYSF